MASEGAINVPQLVVLGVLGYLAFRWIYSSPSSSASTSNPPGSGASSLNSRARGARPSGLRSSGDPSQTVSPTVLTAMNQVLDIFPDTDRRDLAWALSRNPRNAQTVLNQLAEARPLPRVRSMLPLIHNPSTPTDLANTQTFEILTNRLLTTSTPLSRHRPHPPPRSRLLRPARRRRQSPTRSSRPTTSVPRPGNKTKESIRSLVPASQTSSRSFSSLDSGCWRSGPRRVRRGIPWLGRPTRPR